MRMLQPREGLLRPPWPALLIFLLAGCGAAASHDTGGRRDQGPSAPIEWTIPARPIAGLRQREVGEGPRGAVVLWAAGSPPPRRVVIFFHAWQATPPSAEAGWISHLAKGGATVVYPAYQGPQTRPDEFRADALAGIRAALRGLDFDRRALVAIGRTTGAALALDYAALAGPLGMPAPAAVLAIFPGRRPPGGVIAAADLSRVAPGTWLDVVAGPGDPLPGGSAQARASLAAASAVAPSRRRLLTPAFPADVADSTPARVLAAERRDFWEPADRLIARVDGD
jgi:hypothetical protein